MTFDVRGRGLWVAVLHGVATAALAVEPAHWKVEDIRPGMTGHGLTVVAGVQPARFDLVVLGVLRNVEPGRDMVVARFSGLDLEKTGVMAGMSGSPVYIEDKLLGAVAYTWEFGVAPIGGITPFSQMLEYADGVRPEAKERAEGGDAAYPAFAAAANLPKGGRWMPIATPLAVSGMSRAALEVLAREVGPRGLIPVQAGGANPDVRERHDEVTIVPGSAIAIAMVTGDVSVTAVGTVTVNQDGRVYAFGHPFVGLGRCQLPMLSAYIHGVMPLQSASFKFGSPLECIGVFDADVSTTVAGRLGGEATMIPVVIRTTHAAGGSKVFHCNVAPVPQIMGTLLSTSVASCLEVNGMPPQELSTFLKATVRIKGKPPLQLEDTFSGERYQGSPGLVQSLAPLASLISSLTANPHETVEVEAIECAAEITAHRRSATLVHAHVDRREYLAGETVGVVAELRPFRSPPDNQDTVRIRLEVPLPVALAAGEYSIVLSDGRTDAEKEHRPRLQRCRDFRHWHEVMSQQLRGRQTEIVARLATKDMDVAVEGVEFLSLPPAIADVLSSDRSRDVQQSTNSVAARGATDWVIEGSKTVTFHVVERRKSLSSSSDPSPKEPAP